VATEPALYTDSSALVKLIVEERESAGLREHVSGRELVASELVLAEVPRAIQRLAAMTRVPRRRFARGLEVVLGAVALLPLEREVLGRAGAFDAPFLRALDAIHLAAALGVADLIDGFVSYDQRQIEAAQVAGLPVLSPA
jgi:predicted nucleic acid-binding protein